MKKKIIDVESHAFFRMLERGFEFGLDYYETKDRAFKTVRLGKLAKRKHLSKEYKTYYQYPQKSKISGTPKLLCNF